MTALRDELEQALEEAFRTHIGHMVEILMTATDDERAAFERFKAGAVKAIKRRDTLLKLLNEAEL